MIKPRHWLAPTLGLIILGLAAAAAADARPGGGHSYSGSSHSSGGGYSGGSRSSGSSWSSSSSSRGSYSSGSSGPADPLVTLITLGVLVFVVFPIKFVLQQQQEAERFDSYPSYSPPPQPARRPQRVYAELRARDPEFSAVLFEDFVFALYARAHAARRDPAAMAALAPYVSEGSRTALLRRGEVKIHGVVIGRMEVERVRVEDRIAVDIVFEANYTAELPEGPQGYYIHETWTLERATDVRSKPPEAVMNFQCPACGAPYQRSDQGACSHCGNKVEDGRFDWTVTFVRLRDQQTRPPALTGDVQEVGTGLPTVFDPDIHNQHAALIREDPGATGPHIERRLHDIYTTLNEAWTARNLKPIRPHVSDALHNYLAYWIDAYRNQGLTNVLKDMEISRMQIVKLVRDKHFDALTVRFWAAGFDYTTDMTGRRVSGSSSSKRVYSEYWTLIRGAKVRGAPRDPVTCPSCGAPLDRVSMAGTCEYCSAHLTRGEFDWVLSKIEQDEAYTG